MRRTRTGNNRGCIRVSLAAHDITQLDLVRQSNIKDMCLSELTRRVLEKRQEFDT